MSSRSGRGLPWSVTVGPVGRILVGVLLIVSVGLTAWQAVNAAHFIPGATRAFWILALLAVVSDIEPLRIGDRGPQRAWVFVSVCFTFSILLVWGLSPAVCVQVVAVLIVIVRLRLTLTEATLTLARLLLALTAAHYVLELARPLHFDLGLRVGRPLLWYLIGAALAFFITNSLVLVLVSRVLARFPWRILLGRTLRYELLATIALLFLAPVLVGQPRGYLFTLVFIPVIALGQIARLLVRQANELRYDPLTGTLSSRGITSEFSRLCEAAKLRPRRVGAAGLCIIGVEQTAQVRELFGRSVGDRMLVLAADRIKAVADDRGFVGRVSGDEFIIITADSDAVTVARRVCDALRETGYVDGLPFDLSGRVGVAMSPELDIDFVTLMRYADEAAGTARRKGLAIAVYEPQAPSESGRRIELLKDLNDALGQSARRDELSMVYQPQIAIETGEFLAMEALLRWTSPQMGEVSPQRLIEVVEPTVLMHTLTARVIAEVTAQLATWAASGVHVRTAINVSVRDLVHGSIVDRVADVVRQTGIDHDQVLLEITEGALVPDEPRISRAVAELADAGIAVSVDDFGTGYSSLLYLRTLAVAEVKIDRGLVQRITFDVNDRTIVRSIIEMGEALGLRVVAEGVEDQRTRDLLADLNCPAAQGYFYSRPLIPADVPAWLDAHHH